MLRVCYFLIIQFIAAVAVVGALSSASAESTPEGILSPRQHDKIRRAGIDEFKAERALQQAEAERARKEYSARQKGKVYKDRELSPAFRNWQAKRDQTRKDKEIDRKNEARRPPVIIRDRDADKVVGSDERIDYRNRAMYDPSKSLVKNKNEPPSGRVSGSSGYDSSGDYSPPPPPPSNNYAPPAPDFYDPAGDINGFEPQPGDEIPPPIFDEGDF